VSWAIAEHTRTDLPVLIRGDREADFGVALELLAALQEAGLEAVSFQVESPSGGVSAERPSETP
jgi:biopolymer transport protein ExbD